LENGSKVSPVDVIEKLLDVGINNPVDAPFQTLLPQVGQCLMSTVLTPETIREPTEVRLVDGFQDHRHRSLHDLVLQHQDGQRSLAPVPLGYPHSPGRLGSVFPTHQFPVQLRDSLPQVPFVFLHGHLVDARGGVFA
jgi:hypothetical protein